MKQIQRSAAFKETVRRWALRIGVAPKRIQIQNMKKKWASCSTAGRICFSRDLLLQDPAFQEFVIVHELLHLLVPNHGKLFKSLLNSYLPDWERVLSEAKQSDPDLFPGTIPS